jgi:hypothetical protein
MDKKEEEKDVDIEAAAASLDVAEVSFSEIYSDKSTGLPAFSSLSSEALEEIAPFTDFQPSAAVDMTVIKNNQTNKELTSSIPEGQSVSEKGRDISFRQADLFEKQSTGFPAEMDTEELPSNPGGATPRASTGVSNLRGSTDIRTKGNPYGYA